MSGCGSSSWPCAPVQVTLVVVAALAMVASQASAADYELPTTCFSTSQGAATSTSLSFSFGPQPGVTASDAAQAQGMIRSRANIGLATVRGSVAGVTATATAGLTTRRTFTYNPVLLYSAGLSIPWGQIGGGEVCIFGIRIDSPVLATIDRNTEISGVAPAGTTITVRADGTTYCTATTTAGGTWSCVPTSPLPQATIRLEATTTFENNTLSFSREVTVAVNDCEEGLSDCLISGDAFICVDLESNDGNCGACGVEVDDGNACTLDSCVAGIVVNEDVVTPTCPDNATCSTTLGVCQCNSGFAGPNCRSTTLCGNGVLDPGEECDDGVNDSASGCNAFCDIVEGYSCDGELGEPSVCGVTCGDGVILGDETCDDGNTNDGDGCSSTCRIEEGFACTGQPSVCDLVPDPNAPRCGDRNIDEGEECDDGNTNDGDGCSSTCQVEDGFTCVDGPFLSVCTPDDTFVVAGGGVRGCTQLPGGGPAGASLLALLAMAALRRRQRRLAS